MLLLSLQPRLDKAFISKEHLTNYLLDLTSLLPLFTGPLVSK